jgi:glycosyltransferase involved in cell wall biosynthesis
MLDEIDWIERLVSSLEAQDHPLERLEVLIVDGGSTDGSRQVVEALAQDRPWLTLIDNPDRRASSGFNRGIESSTGDLIAIVGAHAEVPTDFISRSVAVLLETGAGGVGGKAAHAGVTPQQQAIGLAMTSRFGMASPFRFSDERREVDTIGHPLYRREVLDETGLFDETLARNSDYELNHRILSAGYRLIFDPEIEFVYRPRSTLRQLGRQFFDYGLGKADVARLQSDSLKPRHFVAPAAAALVFLSPVLAASRLGRRLLLAAGIGYCGVLGAAWSASRPADNDADTRVFLASFPVMHLTWGSGFLLGMVRRR